MRAMLIAAFFLVTVGGMARAETYPTRPITMLVGYAVGGPSDTIARIMADRLKVSLGQPVIVENVTGAAGSLAVGRGARAAPDGYTLVLGDWSTHVVNPAMYDLQYDVVKDFEPVSLLPSAPQIILTPNSVPASNLAELLAWIKANPEKVSYGTAGHGSPSHVSGVLLQNVLGAKFQLVPYRGAALVMQDMIAGTIQISMFPVTVALPQARTGRARPYAITGPQRSAAAPDIPTVDEAGLPNFHISLWWGFWMPKGTPKEIIARMNAAVVEALADPAVQKRIADQGLDVPLRERQSPEALAAYQKEEIDKWWPIIKAANIRGQ
ncbi:MAG: tripartite tricarboxylate transporter substrate binding protein BugD [Hyphomicrobiales bacterium]|nr:tripartite tricarboxylate transporter substrate binding protein BugD [Hyphomicrobiales bacterium]